MSNGFKMKQMILIPSGPFIMGLSKFDVKRMSRRFDIDKSLLADAMPQREIDLPDFYIDKYPVTNAEFYTFALETGAEWVYGQDNPPRSDAENLPAVMVTYPMAEAYAKWAGGRLPTEEEWEKAARGKFGLPFPWGGGWNTERLALGALALVNAHPMGASPYGVMDMAGNVNEWTSTPRSDSERVIKGGCYRQHEAYRFICAYRTSQPENEASDCTGFRCTKETEQR